MWILCPLAPSHGIFGMSTTADLCIPCHILTVLWIIMAVILWTRVVYISYGTVSWFPLHICHTCSFNSFFEIILGALGQIKRFFHIHAWFLISFGIVPWSMWHLHLLCPYCTTTPTQLIVTCLAVLLPLYHAGSILVVLPHVHVDSLSFSTVSWYLCPPLLTYAFHVTFSLYYGSLWQSRCGHVWFIYHMALSHGVRCISAL